MPSQELLAKAWEIFERAASLEARAVASGKENQARLARRNADRKLEEAVKLERLAFEAD